MGLYIATFIKPLSKPVRHMIGRTWVLPKQDLSLIYMVNLLYINHSSPVKKEQSEIILRHFMPLGVLCSLTIFYLLHSRGLFIFISAYQTHYKKLRKNSVFSV